MPWILSQEAESNLIEIEAYTAQHWGDAQAERYLRAIEQGLDRIATTPSIGRMRTDIPPPYLCYAVGRHLIVYHHHSLRARVEVLAILHPAMDIATRIQAMLER